MSLAPRPLLQRVWQVTLIILLLPVVLPLVNSGCHILVSAPCEPVPAYLAAVAAKRQGHSFRVLR